MKETDFLQSGEEASLQVTENLPTTSTGGNQVVGTKRLRRISLLGTILIGAIVFVGLLRSSTWDSRNVLSNLDLFLLDQKFQVRGPLAPSGAITLVTIDDKTLQAYGSMRLFSRRLWAQFIDSLSSYQPRIIAADVMWSEPDPSHPEDDLALAAAVSRAGNVVLGLHVALERTTGTTEGRPLNAQTNPLAEYEEGKNVHPIETRAATSGPERIQGLFRASRVTPDLPALMRACRSFALVNSNPDATGRLRFAPTFVEYAGAFYPTLGVQALKIYWRDRNIFLDLERDRIHQIRVEKQILPTDPFGRLLINYRGSRNTYRTVSMADVLDHRVPAPDLNGKLVLIGATALGLSDVFATPFDRTLPGVEMHATVIDSALENRFVYQNSTTNFSDAVLVILFSLMLGVLLPRLSARNSILFSLALLAVFATLNFVVFVRWGWVMSLAFPGLAIVASSSFIVGCKYLTEERQRAQVKKMFQYYLDAKVVDRLLEQPEAPQLGGEEREITVLFSDIRAFTSFSERLTPSQLTSLLNAYLTEMSAVVLKREGVLDKYIGDAIMAFWGAPLEVPNHAELACVAALEMQIRMRFLRDRWSQVIGMPFDIGIGLNSGSAAVGNMGSAQRFNYTAMGDSVNLASRLEGLNKFYHTGVLISERTFAAVQGKFLCRRLDYVRVKGRQDPVMLYELLAPEEGQRIFHSSLKGISPYSQKFLALYEEGLSFYLDGNFRAALDRFQRVLAEHGQAERATELMMARCEESLQHPAERFSPAFEFQEK